MVGILAEELFRQTVIGEEVILIQVIAVQFSANQNDLRLFKGHSAVDLRRSETCFSGLIAVSSGVSAAEGQRLAELLREERGSEGLVILDESEGIAVRADIARSM